MIALVISITAALGFIALGLGLFVLDKPPASSRPLMALRREMSAAASREVRPHNAFMGAVRHVTRWRNKED